MRDKSRDQPMYDFLECLQIEYVSAEVRSKIYPSNSDRKYHRRVMGYKREKIEDISLRNALPTIFNDQDKIKLIYGKVYTNFGCPSLSYRNNEDRDKFFADDVLNYFSVGSEVKINEENGVSVGVISDASQLDQVWNSDVETINSTPIVVKKRNSNQDVVVLVSMVSRIL